MGEDTGDELRCAFFSATLYHKRPALTSLTGLIRALESTLTTAVRWKMSMPFDVDLHLRALTQQLPW